MHTTPSDCLSMRNDYTCAMKTLMFSLLFMVLLMVGCTLPQVIYVDRPYPDAQYWNMPASQPWVVDPLPQPGSGMSFMCRDAINRRDNGATQVFCR